MKKIISCSLALSMVLGTVVPVNATELVNSVGSVQEDITNETKVGQDTTQGKQSEYHGKITADTTETTNVYATIASVFEVIIPKTVILDGKDKLGHYAVDVNGDIGGTEKINVVPDENFTMSQNNKADITATVEQDKMSWTFDEMETDALGTIEAPDLTAGSWNGTFNFNIKKETTTITPDKEIELTSGITVDAGEVQLGAGQNGTVQITSNGQDVTALASYTSDNPNISVNAGVIDTSNASAGETATITVTYDDEIQTASIMDLFVLDAYATSFQATFTVKVIGIEFNAENIVLEQGQSAIVEANIVPEGTDGTINFKLVGLETEVDGNTITITTTENTKAGNYTLVAEYNKYTEVLMIQVVEPKEHEHEYTNGKCECGEADPEHVHNYTQENIIANAGCETTGTKEVSCVCGDKKTETIEAIGHNYQEVSRTESNCTDTGVINYKCNRCDSTKSETITINPDVHVYDVTKYITDKAATCTESGQKSVHCDKCHVIISGTEVIINPIEHIFKNGICTKCEAEDPNYLEPGLYNATDGLLADWKTAGIDIEKDFSDTESDSNYFQTSVSSGYYVLTNIYPTALKIVIPEGITKLGDCSLQWCRQLTSVKMPESLISIGEYAFQSCHGLTNIEIPSSVTTIGEGAFYNCLNLTSVTIPESVTKIDYYAFKYCEDLKTINYTGTQDQWKAISKRTDWNKDCHADLKIVYNYIPE